MADNVINRSQVQAKSDNSVDTKEVDAILNEIALICHHSKLYHYFLQTRSKVCYIFGTLNPRNPDNSVIFLNSENPY